tara:strand:- start:183 stop:1226 length:1044 start_codon:yes stop_codon:yes gene_type:complete
MEKNKLPISVLFFIGGYENEIYDEKRVKWLKKSINDLKKQSNDPSEILISISQTVYKNKLVKELVETNFTHSNIFISNYYRSPLLNFENLIQLAKQKYICFWSDHDLHHPNYLKELFKVISSNQVSHASSLMAAVVPENDNEIKDSHKKILSPINTSKMGKVKRFDICVKSYIMGSFYGIWEKELFKNLEMVGNEKFDYLYVVASSLGKGYIFFEASENLFGLRIVIKKTKGKYSIHSGLCPSNIFSPVIYSITDFYRFYISVIQIIENSNLSNSEKLSCILNFENSLRGKKNFYGVANIGVKLLIKEFINLITFKSKLHEFLFLLTYSIYAKFLRDKNLNSLMNKN